MQVFYLHLLRKYLLIPRYKCHSMFDFILDLKNFQRISKQKTQDYYYTRTKTDLHLAFFFLNVPKVC